MGKILTALTLISALFLSACTSREGAVKKLVLAEAESKYQTSLQKEAEELIPQSDWLREAYLDYMKKNSEFEIGEIKFQSENLAVATVMITAYSPTQRRMVAKIAGTMSSAKVRQFNFANALQMIAQQEGVRAGPVKQRAGVFKLNKNSAGEWQLQN